MKGKYFNFKSKSKMKLQKIKINNEIEERRLGFFVEDFVDGFAYWHFDVV
jgi:hypothetical protein